MQFLSHLDLSNNNLAQIPDVTSLKSLEYLNINSNRIKDVVNLESRSLRTLLLCENLFHTLDLNVQNLPCLSKIIFGSEACQFVSFQILHRASTGQLELEVTPLYRQNLLMPPLNALDDIQELHNFVKSKEINIRQFNTNQPEQIFQCLTHIVESQSQHYDVLSLADQATLCKSIGFERVSGFFQRLGSRPISQILLKIKLSKCGLESIPNISSLSQLRILDLSDNDINELNEEFLPTSVKRLYVDGNPIVCIKLSIARFPGLSKVRCGSKRTQYISSHLVKKAQQRGFKMTIPKKYQKYLCLPPSKIFTKQNTCLTMSNIQRNICLNA